ncbi:hypothetical protein AWB92_24755 [Mycobacterium sp. IEC1808]|uniref:hypothetical protein n=1 Tax=Mycobacterium sp. IEC1808 TaxID=1743230 RepID=UPI000A15788D|nr:hypothetical protein [Mycobacterium sp. IEC1808]ORW86899.1 hypothetical protein AWB92_24755 [Mycobacterium sp. IEC1808]
MDAALAGLIGAAIGAGIPPTVKGIFDWRAGKAQRQHETDDADQKRRDARLTERLQQVAQWRDGLAAGHAEYQEWLYILNNSPPKAQAFNNPKIPDVAGTAWFQSLRPHLSGRAGIAELRGASEVHCESSIVVALGEEINRIEQAWRDEANGEVVGDA